MGSIPSAEVQSTFKSVDKDHNGILDAEEFRIFIFKKYPNLRSFHRLIMNIYGRDGHMSYDQFEKFLNDSLVKDKNSKRFIPKRIFKYIDTDNSKTVTGYEMKQVINLIELPPNEKFNLADDREMTYNEFYVLVVQIWELAWQLNELDNKECDVE